MLDAATFIAQYDRFATVNPQTIQLWLDTARFHFVPAQLWGYHRDIGIGLLTAHFIEMEWLQTGVTSGVAVAAAAGQGGSSPSPNDDDLLLTTWGRRFKFFRDGLLNGTISPLIDDGPFVEQTNFGIGFPI